MPAPLRRNDVFGALAVIVILIGTATGSAYVMLGVSVTALIILTVFYRQYLGTGAILAACVAAVTAALIAVVVSII